MAARALRVSGWCCIAGGMALLVYLGWALVSTSAVTRAAQADLLEAWTLQVGEVGGAPVPGQVAAELPGEDPTGRAQPAAASDLGDAVALLRFSRPGSAEPLVHEAPLVVTAGVDGGSLQQGPGQYPGTAAPGEPGNFAVAGHRTTYGAPFFHLDRLRPGDEIAVTDPHGRVFTYAVVGQRVVDPSSVWVTYPDPLGNGRPTLTLTTCTPRFSDAQRLVVFAQLRS